MWDTYIIKDSLGGVKMKKLFFMFILISINVLANMDDSPHMMEKHHHMNHHKNHRKSYMKKIHEDENLSQEQRDEIMLLRMDFMNEDRSLNTSLKKVQRDMNHCMRRNKDDRDEEYENLKIERKRLRKEKGNLIRNYKDAVSEVLKKQ